MKGWMTPQVDPRRVLDGALVVVLAGAVMLTVQWALDPDNLPLERVEVAGELRYLEPERVRSALSVDHDTALFGVDLEMARDEIAQLAWVRRVDVSRVWPDTLRATVVERQPVARVNDEMLLDSNGQLFRPGDGHDLDYLPEIRAPESVAADLARLRIDLGEEFERVGRRIEGVEGDARGALRLKLDNGLEVIVGRDARRERVARLIRAWDGLQEGGEGRPVRVDLRYPNGFAVRYESEDDETA